MKFVSEEKKYRKFIEDNIPNIIDFFNMHNVIVKYKSINYFIDNVNVKIDVINQPRAIYPRSRVKRVLNDLEECKERLPLADFEKNMIDRLIRSLTNNEGFCGEELCVLLDIENNNNINPEIKPVLIDLKDAVLDTNEDFWIAGTYDYDDDLITIYTRNNDNDERKVLVTLVHELAHMIHEFHCNSTKNPKKYYIDVVKESLATYTEIQFANYMGYQDIADNEYRYIRRRSPIFCPYAGAKYIIDDRTFEKIYHLALFDLRAAIEELIKDVYELEFILLKKHQNYRVARLQHESYGRPLIAGCPDGEGNIPASHLNGIPIYLIPNDKDRFKKLYELGFSYNVMIIYNDHCENIVVSGRGKELSSDIINHIVTNNSLREKDLTGALTIVIYLF